MDAIVDIVLNKCVFLKKTVTAATVEWNPCPCILHFAKFSLTLVEEKIDLDECPSIRNQVNLYISLEIEIGFAFEIQNNVEIQSESLIGFRLLPNNGKK